MALYRSKAKKLKKMREKMSVEGSLGDLGGPKWSESTKFWQHFLLNLKKNKSKWMGRCPKILWDYL
jgi:hypothetical protein